MLMKKKLIPAAILLIIIAVLVFFYAGNRGGPDSVSVVGIVEGLEVNLSTKVPGRVSEFCCKEGDEVREGSLALKLESTDLQAAAAQALAGVEKANADVKVSEAAIGSARANLASAEADIKNAGAEVDRARVQTGEASRQRDRAQALFKQDYISREALEAAVANHDVSAANHASSKARLVAAQSRKDAATAQLHSSENQLSSAQAAVRQAEANLAFNRARLADTIITTPVSGVVVFKALERGETVSPGATILTVVDLNNLFVRTDIDESRIGNIVLHGKADIRIEGMPGRIFKGEISEIGRYAEFATQRDVNRGRQDIKTFRVKIKLGDAGGILKPGMTVEVEIPKRSPK